MSSISHNNWRIDKFMNEDKRACDYAHICQKVGRCFIEQMRFNKKKDYIKLIQAIVRKMLVQIQGDRRVMVAKNYRI